MPLLYGVCFKYYQNQAKSEDAVMQIFESLITKLRQHEVQNFKPWLYSLARNHCLMDLRQSKKMITVDIDEYPEQADWDATAEIQLKEERLNQLEACLAQLSPEQSQCVRQFYLAKKCYQDIADDTGYELRKVKSYIQNGKRNLKICMERSEGQ